MKQGKFQKEKMHNVVFNEDEFVNFLTGKDAKDLILGLMKTRIDFDTEQIYL